LVAIYPHRKLATFLFSATINASQKGKVSERIETKNEVSKNLEKALQELQRAKQHVANEKKKQNEKKRKAEKHHKYIMGGIVVKYFSDCYNFDEGELNRILSVALQTRECQHIISKIKSDNRETTPPLGQRAAPAQWRNYSPTQCTQRICRPSHLMELR